MPPKTPLQLLDEAAVKKVSAPNTSYVTSVTGNGPGAISVDPNSPLTTDPNFRTATAAEILARQKQNQEAAKTLAGNANSGIISSSDSVVQDEKNTIQSVSSLGQGETPGEAEARAASEAYIALLEKQATDLEKRRIDEVARLERDFDAAKISTQNAQKGEVGTNTVALQRIGGFLGESASSVMNLRSLAESHRQEIVALEGKKASAIQLANNAINDKQFDLAKLMAQEAKDVEKEINKRRTDFFDQALKLSQEQRAQEEALRNAQKDAFAQQKTIAETIAPNIVREIMALGDNVDIGKYVAEYAQSIGADPQFLLGQVSVALNEQKQATRDELTNLAADYPGAGIDPENDTFSKAMDKVRSSREYELNIEKAEADLQNTYSLIKDRTSGGSGAGKKVIPSIEGFYDAKTEDSVRESAVEVLSAGATLEDAFETLRLRYSPSLVTDEALEKVLGITSVGEEDLDESIPGSVTTSPLEEEIAYYKKSGILSDSDIRQSLKGRYSEAEINASSVGGFFGDLATIGNNISRSLFGTR